MTVFSFHHEIHAIQEIKDPEFTNEQIFQFVMFLVNCTAAYYRIVVMIVNLVKCQVLEIHQ